MSTPDDLIVLVPMLGRSHLVAPLVKSLENTTPGADIMFLCTAGDIDVIDEVLPYRHIILPPRKVGDYAHKMNVGLLNTRKPLIFLGAIDIEFTDGWFTAAVSKLSDQIHVVGTNDQANPRTAKGHSTHTLVTREYADRGLIDNKPGLLCEEYVHEFVDDELVGTARKRKAYAHAPDSIVRHLHPAFSDRGTWDESYRKQKQRMQQSHAVYQRRRRLWT